MKRQILIIHTYFNSTITGFKKLTDRSKIDVHPNKIVIREVNENTTLKDYLMKQRVKSTRYEEHAVINGMSLGDLVNKGDVLKIISGDKKW